MTSRPRGQPPKAIRYRSTRRDLKGVILESVCLKAAGHNPSRLIQRLLPAKGVAVTAGFNPITSQPVLVVALPLVVAVTVLEVVASFELRVSAVVPLV
jgi:hypothetical protein